MRYYDIQIFDRVAGAETARRRGDGTPYRWTSYVKGQTDLGALQVEMDIPVTAFAAIEGQQGGGVNGGATVRIWGISLQDIGQSSDLNGATIKIYAGMQKGLPLANPDQKGLLCTGIVNQAFGNWIGNEMTLDMVIVTDGTAPNTTSATPKNLPFLWKKGTPLADAITTTITTGFPGYTADVQISPNLVLAADEPGHYTSIYQFAAYLKAMSLGVLTASDYAGVDVVLDDQVFKVYDGTTPLEPKLLVFTDLIGQPTWIGPQEIQFACVMRADISVGSYVKMPVVALATTTAASLPAYRNKSVFQGSFIVRQCHHIGNFRSPDAQSWISVFNAVPAVETQAAAA